MSAHRKLRRTFTAAVLTIASGAGFIAAAGPAHAAGPWYVGPTGANNAACGASAAAPCLTITFLISQAKFLDGDTINVAAGTYTDRPAFAGKTAKVQGAGAATTVFTGGGTAWALTSNVAAAKTLTLNNLTLTNGKGTNGLGGAFAAGTGQIVMNDVNLTGSTSTNVGGGAYVPAAASGSLTMNGGTISGNSATNGGGAIYTQGGKVTLNGTTIQNNTTPGVGGGGLYLAGGTGHSATNVTFSGNSATGANGAGGGVAGAAGLTITGGSFSANTAVSGGAVYNNTGTITLDGTSLTGNVASYQGGALFQQAGSATLTNATVNGNSSVNLAAVTIIAGTANINGGSISGNTALNGAGLYNGGTTTIDGTTLNGNTANGGTTANGGNGGAIYNAAALTVKNATLTGNKVVANTNAAPGVTGYGGAVYSASLAAAGAPTLSFQNTTINGGNVSGGNASAGGAIAAVGNIGAGGAATVVTANNLTLSKNVALAGGGLYSTGPVTLTNSLVDQNEATHPSAGIGGGIYATPATAAVTLTLDNTDVTGNDGVAGGGGVVATAPVVVKNGSTVNGNTGALGAGLYTGAALTVTDSQVSGNAASNSGGGIYALGTVTTTGSNVDDNSAAFLGGGVVAGTQLSMTGGTVSGNDAYGAGGVFLGNGIVGSLDDTDLVGNTSTGANFGGGAVLSAGQLTINRAQITGNKADGASGLGGAIFSGSDDAGVTTSLKITNSTLSGNEAFSGSALYSGSSGNGSTNKNAISNTTIHGNTATGPFGAIQVSAPTSILGSTITDNTAVPTSPFDAYGGIVAKTANQVSLSGSVLSGNSGHQCNVAVADGGYNLNSPTASECAFSAGKNDVFAAPQLGALANNGGPTTTRLPGATSPALNKIPTSTATGQTDAITGAALTLCTGSDQRGTGRPQGAKCDIGAVEAEQVAPVLTGTASATYSVGVAGAPQAFSASGSPQPTLSATGLPSGVTFTDNGNGTGTLTGTPGANTGGVHAITVKATNEAGSDSKVFTLTITQAPALAGPAGATYTVGQPGGPTTFTSTGHPTPTLSSTGSLPAGVGFADNGDGTGAYSGTPGAGTGGLYPLTVKATNGTPPDASAAFLLTVNQAASITGPGTATFKVGTAGQSAEFTASGFPVPTISGAGLPTGLSVVGTGSGKAKISGNPANGTGGVYAATLTATNGVGANATHAVSVTVNEAPELTGPTEARFVTGTAKAIGFSSDGFPQATLTKTGTLPAGLTFTDNGNGSATISGTAPASAVGVYTVTVKASNGQSPDATTTVTIEVVPPLSIASGPNLPNAAFRSAYSTQLLGAGGQPGYTWQVTVGQLPAGLTMNQFGLISGSPTVSAGIYLFTVKATDSSDPALTATKVMKIQVVKGDTKVTPTAILLGFPANGDITINAGLVEADLQGGFPLQPIANATINFKSGNANVCSGKTDAKGHAQCSQSLLNALLTPLKGNLTATFPGDANWNGSSGTATLVTKG